jgi:hypothetical protein
MRYGCAALLLLISSAVMASAQDLPRVRNLSLTITGSTLLEARVTPDQVVARLMVFDRNGDGKVATTELSERMQVIVARGDTSGDGALDDSEIQALTARRLQLGALAGQNVQTGGYSFGDTVGVLSTRSHIHNTIEDLRLAPQTSEEAWRIAALFVDQLENTACVRLRTAMAPMLTEERLDEFERNAFSQGTGGRVIRITSPDGTSSSTFAVGVDARILLAPYQLTAEQLQTATTVIERFKADLQLDDARRSALVAELKDVLSYEDGDNFRAALARRPVVKTTAAMGVTGGVVSSFTVGPAVNQLRNAVPVTSPVSR